MNNENSEKLPSNKFLNTLVCNFSFFFYYLYFVQLGKEKKKHSEERDNFFGISLMNGELSSPFTLRGERHSGIVCCSWLVNKCSLGKGKIYPLV